MTKKLPSEPLDQNELRRGEQREFPTRRQSTVHEVIIGNVLVKWSVSEFDDGTPGEIFIDTCKDGTTLRSLYNCLAIAVSIGLQYGVPLEKYVSFFTSMSFPPNGFADGDKRIKNTPSIVDYIFRLLALDYLNVKPSSDDPNQKTELIQKK